MPGPAGAAGAAGAAGTNGINSFSTTSAGYTQPAVAATVSVTVVTSAWAIIGEDAYVQNGGYYLVTAIADSTHVTLQNRGYTGNPAPGTVIGAGQRIGPSGVKGLDGVAVGVTMNSISPTTTRGDIIADNGANNPLASDVRLGAGTDGQQLTALAAQPTGLIYRTITPNAATDNVVPRFDASGATTPTPVQSSGLLVTDDGALQSTPTGGNARGAKAVDLQVDRAAATQVASGANATVAGGKNNTASGANSMVSGGTTNTASGVDSSVSGGATNVASGQDSAVSAGNGNTASAQNSFVAGGLNNTASGVSSAVLAGDLNVASGQGAVAFGESNTASGTDDSCLGGAGNTASGGASAVVGGLFAKAPLFGQVAHANGRFVASADAQVSEIQWRVSTTDATVGVEMFLDGAGASKRASIDIGSSWLFQLLLVARSSAGVDAAWKAEGLIHNTGGATALVAGPIVPVVIADGTGGTWGLAANFIVTADNANDTLKLAVTGAGATLIRWVAYGRIVQVSYP